MINAQTCHLALTGEQLVGVQCPYSEMDLAVGIIKLFANNRAGGVSHNTNRVKIVFQGIAEHAIDSCGYYYWVML